MDDRRFDAITRSLASGLSRRKVLKGLFGGAVLGGAAAARVERAAAEHCLEGEFHCEIIGTAPLCCDTATECCATVDGCCAGECFGSAEPPFPNCCPAAEGSVCGGECCPNSNTCCDGACCAGHCILATQECCPTGVSFECGGECCPDANTCCDGECCAGSCVVGRTICCPTQVGFPCGDICCDNIEGKCCGGVCISSSLCCPLFEPEDCPPGQFCCENGACADCCTVEDCLAAADTCIIVSCEEGQCIFTTIVCEDCEACDTGQCVSTCTVGETCCPSGCEDLQNDPTNCGACAADCSLGLLCCAGHCQQCCDNEDCDPCARCVNGTCERLVCGDPCEFCFTGECERVCELDQVCCITGPPEDVTITCVDECCGDDDDDDGCGECESCQEGTCEPDKLPICELGLVVCCVEDEFVCVDCCNHDDCGPCEHCSDNVCIRDCPLGQICCLDSGVPFCAECCEDEDCVAAADAPPFVCCEGICREFCCPEFGDPCGLLITVADGSPQLDCCHGLVCCETKEGSFCAECCSDHDCPKGTICCGGVCREIECCIDDILVGLDPNRRCPKDCTCFEGICIEPHSGERCDPFCDHDKDCPHGTCCCKDGTCHRDCCPFFCKSDKDCAHGTCCCHDGSCSAKCCAAPKPTPPAGGTVTKLPGTGSGGDSDGLGIAGVAAFGAMAAYLAAKKLRDTTPGDRLE